MEEEKQISTSQNTEIEEQKTFSLGSKEFPDTDEGRNQAKAWVSKLETSIGKQGQKLGQLSKYEKAFELSKDEKTLQAEIAKLQSEGEFEKASDLLFGYHNFRDKKRAVDQANEKWFDKYVETRKDKFEVIDPAMVKAFITSNEEFLNAPNQVEWLDGYLEPQIKTAKIVEDSEVLEDTKPVNTLTSSRDQKGESETSKNESKDAEKPNFDKIMFDASMYNTDWTPPKKRRKR